MTMKLARNYYVVCLRIPRNKKNHSNVLLENFPSGHGMSSAVNGNHCLKLVDVRFLQLGQLDPKLYGCLS